MTGGGV